MRARRDRRQIDGRLRHRDLLLPALSLPYLPPSQQATAVTVQQYPLPLPPPHITPPHLTLPSFLPAFQKERTHVSPPRDTARAPPLASPPHLLPCFFLNKVRPPPQKQQAPRLPLPTQPCLASLLTHLPRSSWQPARSSVPRPLSQPLTSLRAASQTPGMGMGIKGRGTYLLYSCHTVQFCMRVWTHRAKKKGLAARKSVPPRPAYQSPTKHCFSTRPSTVNPDPALPSSDRKPRHTQPHNVAPSIGPPRPLPMPTCIRAKCHCCNGLEIDSARRWHSKVCAG